MISRRARSTLDSKSEDCAKNDLPTRSCSRKGAAGKRYRLTIKRRTKIADRGGQVRVIENIIHDDLESNSVQRLPGVLIDRTSLALGAAAGVGTLDFF